MKSRFGMSILIVLLTASAAFAFKVGPELQAEISQKEAAVKAVPNDPHAYFDLAMTYAYSNKIMEGWDQLKKVNELDPEYAPKAVKIYADKLKTNSKDWKARFRLAFALFFNDDKLGAIEEFEEILKIDPNNIWALGYMAVAYGERDDFETAINLCKKAIKIDRYVSSIHFALGQAYYKKGDSWNGFWSVTEAIRLKAMGH